MSARAPRVDLLFLDGRWLINLPWVRTRHVLEGDIGAFMESVQAPAGAAEASSIEEIRQISLHAQNGADAVHTGDDAWDAYFAGRRHVPYANYSDAATLDVDASLMRAYSADQAFPTTDSDTAEWLRLPHPALGAPRSDIERLAHALFWSFGALRWGELQGAGEVFHSPAPSKGALQPTRAYVVLGEAGGDAHRLWRYDPEMHALVPAGALTTAAAQTTVLLTLRFERALWRYRHDWAYKDVFFDLGHARTALQYACDGLNIGRVERDASMFASQLDRPLTEEVMAAFTLEFHDDRGA